MHVEYVLEKQVQLILHVICQYEYVPNVTKSAGQLFQWGFRCERDTDVVCLCGVIVKDYGGSCVLCDVILVVIRVFIF